MEIFEVPVKVWKLYKFWLQEDSSAKLSIVYISIRTVVGAAFGILAFVNLFTSSGLADFTLRFAQMTLYLILFVTGVHLHLNQREIEALLKMTRDLIEYKNWVALQKGVKLQERIAKMKRQVRVFLTFNIVAAILSSIMAYSNHKLQLQIYAPFDILDNSNVFWCLALFQVGSLIAALPSVTFYKISPNIFMAFVTGFLEELEVKLGNVEHITDTEETVSMENVAMSSNMAQATLTHQQKKDQVKRHRELLECIEIHIKIKALAAKVEETFSTIVGFQLSTGVCVLTTVLFSIVNVGFGILLKIEIEKFKAFISFLLAR